MKAVKGNKLTEIDKTILTELTARYGKVILDMGTGDGRFTYVQAKNNPGNLVIGLDPSQKQLETYSKKAVREKLNNALFILGSFELLPTELTGIADKTYINLPWGSLLQVISKPDKQQTKKLRDLLKDNGELEILLGYTHESEPGETARLGLPEINQEYILKSIKPVFEDCGFTFQNAQILDKKELFDVETTWSKKLSFGTDRPIFRIRFLAMNS